MSMVLRSDQSCPCTGTWGNYQCGVARSLGWPYSTVQRFPGRALQDSDQVGVESKKHSKQSLGIQKNSRFSLQMVQYQIPPEQLKGY